MASSHSLRAASLPPKASNSFEALHESNSRALCLGDAAVTPYRLDLQLGWAKREEEW
jgi:hypothetical protein